MRPLVLVSTAADFAARKHCEQRRKGRAAEPYLNHLAEVACLLAEATDGCDPHLIAAGWLHDVVEDTATTLAEVAEAFGPQVMQLVADTSDDKSLPKQERKRRQIETAASKSDAAKCLKIADKISNLRALLTTPPDDWERRRKVEYLDWADRVVAGCRGVNDRLDRLFDRTLAHARQVL